MMRLKAGSASRLRRYAMAGDGLALLERFGRCGLAAYRDQLALRATGRLRGLGSGPGEVRRLEAALTELEPHLGDLSDALVLDTSWYKDSLGAGFVRIAGGPVRFVKVFRSPSEATRQLQLIDELRVHLPDGVRVPSGTAVIGSTLLTDAIEDGQPVSGEEASRVALDLSRRTASRARVAEWRWSCGSTADAILPVVNEVTGGQSGHDVLVVADHLSRVPVAPAHGDLVPWNLLAAKGSLFLIDFEDAGELPAYFDLAHSIIQPAALRGEPYAVALREALVAQCGTTDGAVLAAAAALVEISRCVSSWSRFPANRRVSERLLRTHVIALDQLAEART